MDGLFMLWELDTIFRRVFRPGSVFRFHKTDEVKEFAVDWGWLFENLGKSVDVIMVASDNTSSPRATNIIVIVGEGEDSETRSFEVLFEV